MGQRKEFARAGAAEDIPAIPAVMLSVREGEGGSTSHANVGVDPLWGLEFGLLAECHMAAWMSESLTALLSIILLAMFSLGGKRKPSCWRVR